MPVDFNRVPLRVTVPPAPRATMVVWAVVLVLMMSGGGGLIIALWPADRSTSELWFCASVYPLLAWAFLLFAWLGHGYTRRNQAIATNLVSDEAEQACNVTASRPLAILGHAWCFSADDSENSLEELLRQTERAKPRPSGAVADREVDARWLDIPDMYFRPGNKLAEYARHQAVCRWLLERLINPLTLQLQALPRQTKLQVELAHRSRLKSGVVEARIRELLAERIPALTVDVVSSEHRISLFRTDAWHDNQDVNTAYLIVAIELRDAISAVLSDGVAETGVALLVGRPRLVSPALPNWLALHRPAKGKFDAAATTLEAAIRWGQSSRGRFRTVWAHGVARDSMSMVPQAVLFADETRWISLETLVGDCSDSGSWLAVALGAENARMTGEPQLVLCGEGEELMALTCKKRT